jgi:hypothetical protein
MGAQEGFTDGSLKPDFIKQADSSFMGDVDRNRATEQFAREAQDVERQGKLGDQGLGDGSGFRGIKPEYAAAVASASANVQFLKDIAFPQFTDQAAGKIATLPASLHMLS